MDTSFIWAVSSRLDSLLCLNIICEFDVNLYMRPYQS